MYSQFKIKLLGLILIAGILGACKETENPVIEKKYPTAYSLQVPPGFPQPYLSLTNPLTVEGIELGRYLYADSILSTNGRSCTSCHIPAYSFSRPIFNTWSGYTISVPPHINLAFKTQYNWEGSEECLDTLATGDFTPEFFNPDPVKLLDKLSAHPIYPKLFEQAFGIKDLKQAGYELVKRKIANAIAQYLRTRISSNSKFDKYRRKEALLEPMEYEGYVLFFSEKGDCFHCHSEPLFTDQQAHNNGISASYTGFDAGRFAVTHKSEDLGKFITPTLRNIELTAPYMHDGRFNTLEEVIDHYDHGVNENSFIDPLMTKSNGSKLLNLTPIQKFQLVAFMKTLTDTEVLSK